MKNDEMKSLIQKYINFYNSFNIEGMLQLLDENITFRNVSNGVINTETKGINQFRRLAEQSKRIFSERYQTINHYSIKGDQVEVEVDYEGILATDLPNGPKAGETLKIKGKTIFTFKNKKLSVIEDYS
ncbi:nuclear transport factor 2 family protein [Priestia filamentosa]|uniref:nuclear transport factor 2 family protein n=1 Tax=Priestia filamentosa TaxID=1402861 RepID=UPI0028961E0C|nr:nuclear transport factor 2 family protein [Priestia filamentosa]MDT3766356.1 nuclear transport factor 2 family protein [Priestia filamentosa]